MSLIYAPYLPRTKPERSVWLQNFANVVPHYQAIFALTDEQAADVSASALFYSWAVTQNTPSARTWIKSLADFEDELDTDSTPQFSDSPVFMPPIAPQPVMGGIFNRMVEIVNTKIFTCPGLTPALRTALRLDPITPASQTSPKIRKITALPGGHNELSFSRGGCPLVIIEMRRGSGEFTQLQRVAATHYLDVTPNAVAGVSEAREYRIRYTDGINGVGSYSPIVSVATQP